MSAKRSAGLVSRSPRNWFRKSVRHIASVSRSSISFIRNVMHSSLIANVTLSPSSGVSKSLHAMLLETSLPATISRSSARGTCRACRSCSRTRIRSSSRPRLSEQKQVVVLPEGSTTFMFRPRTMDFTNLVTTTFASRWRSRIMPERSDRMVSRSSEFQVLNSNSFSSEAFWPTLSDDWDLPAALPATPLVPTPGPLAPGVPRGVHHWTSSECRPSEVGLPDGTAAAAAAV
mmetsp:Transcript_142922/g.398234  ORF Transcript_142922/g.398234 Transcript_142922/m.398234 type:complete len:231 (+) Transcript_142922:262-954(+)